MAEHCDSQTSARNEEIETNSSKKQMQVSRKKVKEKNEKQKKLTGKMKKETTGVGPRNKYCV